MSVVSNNILAGASGQGGGGGGYEIERSLRFNSADSAYLSKTFVNTAAKTYTISVWIKRSKLGVDQRIYSTNAQSYIAFDPSGQLHGNLRGTTASNSFWYTEAKFRDVSAWYHIVVTYDLTNSTQADRLKIYVNGVEQTFTNTNFPSNAQHSGGTHTIGGPQYYADFMLADVHFIDGQALAATDFGETDNNGVWQPKEFAGTYGTNGFHLDFADNSSNAALGNDAAGSNNWTVNNLSVASAVNYSVRASVTAGSVNRTVSDIFDGRALNSTNPNAVGNSGVWNTSGFTISYSPGIAFSTQLDINALISGNGGIDGSGSSIDIQLSGGTFFSIKANKITGVTNYDTLYRYVGSGTLTGVRISPTSGFSAILNTHYNNSQALVNNLSGSDSLVDVPTNGTQTDTGVGGEVVGNYATLNPLIEVANSATYSNGNLDASSSVSEWHMLRASIGVTSGKWLAEYTTTGNNIFGIDANIANTGRDNINVGAGSIAVRKNGTIFIDGVNQGITGSSISDGSVVGLALDLDSSTKTLKVYIDGSLDQTINLTSNFNSTEVFFAGSLYGTAAISFNFGQRPFAYTAPSGYKCLNTANLPEPTIADGSQYFDTKLYTGNGGTNAQTGLGFSPDFLWLKRRNGANAHALFDQIRGVTKALESSNTGAEKTNDPAIGSFGSNGFTLTGSSNQTNASGQSYVAWAWDAGTSTVTNNDGSIASQVRANPSAGFSIVSWTGSGANATIGHSLGSTPSVIICKNRDQSISSWDTYHSAIGNTGALRLNLTNETITASDLWNNTSPTSTVFTVSTSGSNNASGQGMIAYCFAPVEGYSAMGSYTGNGSANGPFVNTGFRPAWVMIKRYSTTGSWMILDAGRNPENLVNHKLSPNSSNEEDDDSTVGSGDKNSVDFLSNGFKLRSTNGETNGSGDSILYAAFAEHPLKTARAR